ncbi:hypothetical protein [Limosilactobacillus fermentum]|uniref:hypothetical protein n=1 Tax=Limosilactobacillus fermentum TaxID=1613 RepID=UPI0021A8B584|nr:hypothetical protein [Limosilactobacillus fermentum]MCT2870481.1 hypothetical protein [Limosilactobacillus fermentum]
MGLRPIDIWDEPSPFQNEDAYEQKQHNWMELRGYFGYYSKYLTDSAQVSQDRIDNLIKNAPQPSETVDARTASDGTVYATLHARLVGLDDGKIGYEDASQLTGVTRTLKLRGFGENSSSIKESKLQQITDDYDNHGQEGLKIISVSAVQITRGSEL